MFLGIWLHAIAIGEFVVRPNVSLLNEQNELMKCFNTAVVISPAWKNYISTILLYSFIIQMGLTLIIFTAFEVMLYLVLLISLRIYYNLNTKRNLFFN